MMALALGEQVAQTGQLPVFGTEVVAPMADTVRFVDGEGAHAGLA
jgi:hypothetical protein